MDRPALIPAEEKMRWNFRTAIPSCYPRMNAMSLLLPLCLVDELHADAALVVQLMASGDYRGQTILTMEQGLRERASHLPPRQRSAYHAAFTGRKPNRRIR